MDIKDKKTLIDRLRLGEKILCYDCKKGYYNTTANNISISHEFHCEKCGSVVRITPNIIVE